jgi:hypothetical protein
MVPAALFPILSAAGVLSLLLGATGVARRSTPLLVAAALLVLTAAGFAFSTIALS